MSVASDLSYQLLKRYIKTGTLSQTTQDKPLLRELNAASKPFSGGLALSFPVQGVFMSDTNGFFAGYSEDDALVFTQAQNALRAEYNWYEHHSGLEITWSELKKDGISVVDDGNKTREQQDAESVRITTGVLKNRIEDFGDSWSRMYNKTLWLDGSQDAKVTPGIMSLLTDTPTTGTTGSLSRATYTWWRHRALVGANKVTASATQQTLTKKLRSEMRLLRQFGGKPNLWVAGSEFIDALELEVAEKGIYTQEGFVNEGKTDIGMADIRMRGVGTCQYDPTMNDLGMSRRSYFIDTRRTRLMKMRNEDNKVMDVTRPYNAAVYLQSMFTTVGMVCDQLNANEIVEVAAL